MYILYLLGNYKKIHIHIIHVYQFHINVRKVFEVSFEPIVFKKKDKNLLLLVT